VDWVKVLFGLGKGSLGDGGIGARLPNAYFQPTRLPSAVSGVWWRCSALAVLLVRRFVVRRSAEAERYTPSKI
jgi:hypothetical protein